MAASSSLTSRQIRFGEFILDLDTAELLKNGYRSTLQGQPFQILQILFERPGCLVTRDELKKRLWPSDTFVDFDQGLNKAVKRLREALEDSADHPIFIETVPRRGYRFVGPAVKALAPPDQSNAPSSIAVLPFTNMSTDPENEYFVDGITEEIINALTQIEELSVAARSSSFTFKNEHVDLRIVGERLNVKTVLQGSVRKSGSRVRIVAQLINVADGYHLWSEHYDQELKELFEVQDEIALAIVSRLKVVLNAGQQPSVNAGTSNLEAYELYLKGRALLYRGGLDIRRSAQCFESAVALDPHYPLAWSGLSDARLSAGLSGLERPAAVMPQAKEAATRAVTLGPILAETHCSLAMIHVMYDWDWAKAEREFLRALALNPRHLRNLLCYGSFYLAWAQERFDEGIALVKKALEYDPLSASAWVALARTYYWAGKGAEAVVAANSARELEESFSVYFASQSAFHLDRQFDKAAAAGEMALAMSGRNAFALSTQALIYANCGKIVDAQGMYEELVDRAARAYIPPIRMALAASAAGELELAVGHVREAFEVRDPWVIGVKHCPDYERLRKDPRINEIVARSGLK